MNDEPQRVRLVVVDDDDAGRRMLRRVLERRGYEVFEASDGVSGIEAIHLRHPSAVLLDLRMPGELSGIDVMHLLREDDPEIATIPVIIVSASVHTDVQRLVAEVGAAGFVEKPIDFATLYETLERVLSQPAGS